MEPKPIVELHILGILPMNSYMLLDNFTPNSNYLRSVPLEFLIDFTGLTGFRSMNVLFIDWLTKH